MSVFSVRIKSELRKKMEKCKGRVNRPEGIREEIEKRIRELEAEENSERIPSELRNANWSVPSEFSTRSVRGRS
jgi:predicted DNA-binding protein